MTYRLLTAAAITFGTLGIFVPPAYANLPSGFPSSSDSCRGFIHSKEKSSYRKSTARRRARRNWEYYARTQARWSRRKWEWSKFQHYDCWKGNKWHCKAAAYPCRD